MDVVVNVDVFLMLLLLPTCAHIYPDAYKILKTCPQTERAKRAECVRITYLSLTYYLLITSLCLLVLLLCLLVLVCACVCFLRLLGPHSKSQPTTNEKSTKNRSNIDPKSVPNRSKISFGTDLACNIVFGPFWDRFGSDFGAILVASWVKSGSS